jgi:hypothetical protein
MKKGGTAQELFITHKKEHRATIKVSLQQLGIS